jgi:DNA-directed RNA polymerase subunit RPC12/RpoP
MTYEPFKCPDCSVWWRGETHKCELPPAVTVTVKPPAVAEKTKSDGWNIGIGSYPKHYNCYVCGKELSKLDLVQQYKRCKNCRNTKGHGRYGKYKEYPSHGNA